MKNMQDLKNIVSDVLGIDPKEINDELSRNKAEAWDSFNHLLLVSEIEKRLGIKLTMQEVEQICTFKDLCEIISSK